MSETEAKAQGQKPRISKLAIASPLFFVAGYIVGLVADLELTQIHHYWGLHIFLFLSFGSLLTGTAALITIIQSKGKLIGITPAAFGIAIGVIWLIYCLLPPPTRIRKIPAQIKCAVNLNLLGKAMFAYGKDLDNEYPTSDKWCDLLLRYTEVGEEAFTCPTGGKGRSHYAMNPNCEANSPGDVVLLFETKGGWNQFGGPELLTTENHKGEGCNILFNDIHVEFVKPERLGELKWKVEEGNSVE